jgi:hypothetical protein
MSKLIIGLLLLGMTEAQAGGPLDDVRGPVNQAIECKVKHGPFDPQCFEYFRAVGRLCGLRGLKLVMSA